VTRTSDPSTLRTRDLQYLNLSMAHRAMAEKFGLRPALRFKQNGRFQDLSWLDYRRQVDEVAAGLIALGIAKGDAVAILSENRHEWLIADLAILAIGAVNVPLHAPLSSAQVEYQLGHSRAKAMFVSNKVQADKVQVCRHKLPGLEFVVAFDPIGDDLDACGSWDGLKQLGATEPRLLAEISQREASIVPTDLATIIYTSGTTGHPKGVMLSHNNLLTNAQACANILSTGDGEIQLSWLPYSHIYARTCDHYTTMLAGSILCLAESMETILADFNAVGATRMNSVPRFYDKVWASVERLSPEERERRLKLAFGPTLRALTSGGAPLPLHVAAGFNEAGLNLLEGYGLTEASPVISFNEPEHHKDGTVGRAIPGVEIRIADDGEILTRGPHVMLGYWQDPEATRATIKDGWLHTGDIGQLDNDGFLTITDRKKDLIITSCGKNIAPATIEGLLTADPYIDQAVIIGDRKPFVSALIVPNFPAIEAKAKELGCSIERDGEMISTPVLRDFFAERVERLMEAVSQPERVRAFLLLGRPFQADAGEMTATLKVRRRHILQAYEDRLEALYAKAPKLDAE
jgi:long-chain acyl-CoA synthetase